MPFLLPLILNWRTTLMGAGAIAAGVKNRDIGTILIGTGLVFAQDSNFLKLPQK